MSAALLAPDEEAIENRIRFTVEECYRFRDLGFFDGRFEILDGAVVTKMGQKPAHRMAMVLLAEWLGAVFGAWQVQVAAPIAIPSPDGVFNEPHPDLAVTEYVTTVYANRHPGPADLLLVVEVSDASLRNDLVLKARLYARAGIPEYWALDLAARQLHVHRNPSNGEYTSVTILAESESISPTAYPERGLLITSLLPPADPRD